MHQNKRIIMWLRHEYGEGNDNVKTVIEALEKQIPKKQETTESPFEPYCCPNCRHSFDCDEEYYLGNGEWFYCGKCGQRIDWSKE